MVYVGPGVSMQFAIDYWPIKLIYDWQTLIAGLFALTGALWTVKKIRDQIQQTRVITEDIRKRDELAARSVLPLALSELTSYALQCMRLMLLISKGEVPKGMEIPILQKDVISVLQESARYAQDDIASKIWVLLSKLQVQQSRLRALLIEKSGRALHENDVVENTLDAADIHAKTAELYTYARDEEGMRRRAGTDKLRSALHAIGVYDPDDHPALAYLARRAD
jgi:hypothetical protein